MSKPFEVFLSSLTLSISFPQHQNFHHGTSHIRNVIEYTEIVLNSCSLKQLLNGATTQHRNTSYRFIVMLKIFSLIKRTVIRFINNGLSVSIAISHGNMRRFFSKVNLFVELSARNKALFEIETTHCYLCCLKVLQALFTLF